MKKPAYLLVATLGLLTVGQIANALPLAWATDFENSSLYEVDFGANTATPIGSTGFTQVTGLAVHPGTGTLFGIDDITGQLITLDTTTGAGTAVGSLGISVFGDVGLAFDDNGNLFMSSDGEGGTDDFFSVNVSSGAATLIGSTGTSGVVGLDFAPDGTLFGLVDTRDDNLVTLDTLTGAATVVGALGLTTNTGGIGFDGASLYAAFGLVNPGLTTIDPVTGLAALPVDLGIDFSGLAMQQRQIPEPGTLVLFGAGLLGLGLRARRR